MTLSVAELQALTAVARELPRIAKALERIADALEPKETKQDE